jgi:hypothetical protein
VEGIPHFPFCSEIVLAVFILSAHHLDLGFFL